MNNISYSGVNCTNTCDMGLSQRSCLEKGQNQRELQLLFIISIIITIMIINISTQRTIMTVLLKGNYR